jgi:8-amino-7-oxononanoate synthase
MTKTMRLAQPDPTASRLGTEREAALRTLHGSGFTLPDLIASSPGLGRQLASLLTLGESSFSSLFDRQNAGPAGHRIVLGPPARPEFNQVADAAVSVLNLATSGYLDLGGDPRVKRAAIAAVERFGTHTGGCRLLSGTTPIHHALEERLADFVRAPSVVTYSSGYATNVSVVSSLFGPGDLIILDRHAHRSLYDGAVLSRARIARFAHNDVDHLERVLRRTAAVPRRLVAVDAVYSMEGRLAPLPELIDAVQRHRAFLLVDEAHALGVLGERGRGAVEHFGLDPGSIDIRIGTLSKAMAAAGGFAAVHASVGVLLRYTSPARVFSAAMTPPDAAAALAAVEIIDQEPHRVARLRANAARFRGALADRGLDVMGSETPIVPILVGDRLSTLSAAHRLLARGVFVNPVVAPGVPAGTERLRCLVSAAHRGGDLDAAAETIAGVVRNPRG